MTGLLPIFRRELAGLFLAPLAWILFCLALSFNAFFFLLFLRGSGGEVNGTFVAIMGTSWSFWFLLLVLAPLLTMRMVSEESRSGLLEFLLTAPVGDGAVIVGKALAATTFLSVLWSSVLVYGVLVHALGAPPDWGQLLMQWLGATLLSALFCSIGIVSSAVSGTPILAAFMAVVFNCALVFGPRAKGLVRGEPRQVVDWVADKADIVAHYQGSFLTGALDSAHVVFFLAWILALLFIAVRVIESRRWLG